MAKVEKITVRLGLSIPTSDRPGAPWVKPEAELVILLDEADQKEGGAEAVFEMAWPIVEHQIDLKIKALANAEIIYHE